MKQKIHGRVIHLEPSFLTLQNERESRRVEVSTTQFVSVGDLIEIDQGTPRILTQNRTHGKTMKWSERTLHPRRLKAMDIRFQVETGIREFFHSQGFRETRTPLLVPCPGMEPHIRPFAVRSTHSGEILSYLPTSPEFAMKRLLVGGLEKIFQMSHSFRNEPHSVTHHPEFTMLEWYRAYSTFEEIMADTEALFESLANRIFGKPTIQFQDREISVKAPWPRLKVRDLFQDQAGIDLTEKNDASLLAVECNRLGLKVNPDETWDDLYFKIWLNCIEPHLPASQAVFVTRYPASQAALAVIDSDPDGSHWAKRFEVYAGGIELGNAFEELTDPQEQRARFLEDMELREEIYGSSFPRSPLDEDFLEALTEGMPPSGGIAVGVDRMVMLFANETHIDYTTWL